MQVSDIEFKSADHVLQEIRDMNVKGGSPFGRAAAWAYRLACEQERFPSVEALLARCEDLASQMHELKPTMATINNSSSLVCEYVRAQPERDVETVAAGVMRLCDNIIESSLAAVERLGSFGGERIPDGGTVLMHSYSSSLMGCFEAAAASGKRFTVICTESRPLRESRLAVDVLHRLGQHVVYITDAEVYEFMRHADLVIMGADSLASDGSVANKMGTAMIARLARSMGIPVYIASELYKYDERTLRGRAIELERRDASEIVSEGDFRLGEPEVINQFFDVTPATDVTAIVCEHGFIAPASVSLHWEQLKDELMKGVM